MGLFNFKKSKSKNENEKLPYEAQLYLLAISALQNGEHQKSLDLFNNLINNHMNKSNLTDQEAGFYYNRSIAKTQLNDIEGAINDLKTSIKIHELNQAYYELFRLYQFKEEPQKGLTYLIKAYELGNENAEQILRENTNYFNQ